MKSIDLEAHFYTEELFKYLEGRKDFPMMVDEKRDKDAYHLRFTETVSLFQTSKFLDRLCDIDTVRIAEMDKAGLDTQVLSFSSPGIDEFYPDSASALKYATELNDLIYDATQRHPSRFKGFATISPYDVNESVKELERCVNKLGFVGWLAHSNFNNELYLDDKEYWPLLEAAEALSIPIYVHPTTPTVSIFGKYEFPLAGPPLGFQVDVALCIMRMIYAGVFDHFPKLQVIIGHMGECLPFLMPERIDWAYSNPHISTLDGFIEECPKIKRKPSEYLLENLYVTTSGRYSKALMEYVIAIMGEDRVMLATDYPYEDLCQSMDFIKNCGLSDKVLNKLCHGNWDRVFGS